MWIETQYGRLVNCDTLNMIDIGDDNASVVGLVSNNEYPIASYDSTSEAKATLKEIKQALRENTRVYTVK